jgi:hypothetical protein
MTCHDDPTLDQLLGDPITQALMTVDRVDPLALAAMLRSMAREISGRSDARVVARNAACRVSESHIRSQHAAA